jgi:CarD family transcriptional regulator
VKAAPAKAPAPVKAPVKAPPPPDPVARASRSVAPPPPAPIPASALPPSPPPAHRQSSHPSVRPSNHPPSLLPPRPYIPPGPPPVFKIGDKAVHPAHGLGEIVAIENREFNGAKALYYIIRILDNGMKVMVPTNAVTQAGLRSVMGAEEAEKVLETMRAREVAVDLQPWSRRFRAYTEMIKSGSPFEVAKVLRDMHRLRFDKDLSFGERRLLDQAKSLLVKELALSKKMTEAELLAEVVQIFKA